MPETETTTAEFSDAREILKAVGESHIEALARVDLPEIGPRADFDTYENAYVALGQLGRDLVEREALS